MTLTEKQHITATVPDERGFYGKFGGRYVPEILIPALDDLQKSFVASLEDESFVGEYKSLLKEYVGRETPLTYAGRLTEYYGKAKIYLKREDLCHTGAHKINNAIGQVLLARKMGKTRIIAETGAGQHGVATATVCAHFGIPCIIYMGAEDIVRQKLNVDRIRLLGAEVRPVESGAKTLSNAINEAIRDWVSNVDDTFYIIGSAVGPHPYPQMVREFQSVIGHETIDQCLESEGTLPDHVIACIGGGSNAIGMFHPMSGYPDIRLYGIEAAGEGVETSRHAATLGSGYPGILHGSLSYLLQSEHGQIAEAHSVSAGLDYPGVGPEHSYLRDSGRVTYDSITDAQALEGVKLLSSKEGIIPALETAHAVAYLEKLMPQTGTEEIVVINCSGRGDKDMETISKYLD
ncbi:tryptophan synthase subunit beta [Balneolales bacterium ANBcel1]|nr:tryptophan synthase subunit beta [Balneolales bacterium ANBcel1]